MKYKFYQDTLTLYLTGRIDAAFGDNVSVMPSEIRLHPAGTSTATVKRSSRFST